MSLRSILSDVYSQSDVEWLVPEVEKLIAGHQHKFPSFQLDEKDVLLITYGDQLHEAGVSRLQSLKKFADQYLSENITTIHLLPFYPYSSDDGFSVIDYEEVNPDLGTWEDIQMLSSSYLLMFDAVINHISKSSAWVQGYLNDEPAYQDYFISEDPSKDFSQVTRPRTLPLLHPFTDHQGQIRHLWTTFSEDQVDLNYKNPRVFLEVLKILMGYLQKGGRLLRLDAIGFMWKEDQTSCIHLPQAHRLIQAMRKALEAVDPSAMLITETNVPHRENISYFGNGHDEARMVYNFTLPPLLAFSILSQDTTKLTTWAKSLELPSKEVCFFNFTASHDGLGVRPVQGILDDEELTVLTDAVTANKGFISYKSNPDGTQSPYELNCNYFDLLQGTERDRELGFKRMVLAQAVMLCMPGFPAIYFHSLVGSTNDLNGVAVTGRYRSINREKLEYNDLVKALEDPNSLRSRMLKQISGLIAHRKQYEAFHPFGNYGFEDHGSGLFTVVRRAPNDRYELHCLFNLTSKMQPVPKALQNQRDVLDGITGKTTISPYDMAWFSVDLN